jgi:hypothetical protein
MMAQHRWGSGRRGLGRGGAVADGGFMKRMMIAIVAAGLALAAAATRPVDASFTRSQSATSRVSPDVVGSVRSTTVTAGCGPGCGGETDPVCMV